MRRSKKNIQTKFQVNKKLIILLIVIWILSFFVQIWPMVFIAIFCTLNALLLSLDRYLSLPIDMELSNFSTILITLIFGLSYGLLTAILTKFADMIYNKRVKVTYFFMISSYMIAALLANKITGLSVVSLGILVSLLSGIYLGFVRKFVAQYSFFEIIVYGGSNFLFNMVMFIGFSQPIYNIMKTIGG